MPRAIVFVCCNTEEAWHRRMAEACELEWAEHEHELDLEEAEGFQHLEIGFCDMREDVDPYWVSDWFDVAEPDPALIGYEVLPYHEMVTL